MPKVQTQRILRFTTRSLAMLSLSFALFNSSFSQDQLLTTSPYYTIPMNPATTGQFNGIWRAAGTYRMQQLASGDALSTVQAGIDGKLPFLEEKLGAGLLVYNDDAGAGRIGSTKVMGAISYAYSLGENHFRGGVQGGFVSSTLGAWNSWNRETHSYTAPSGETGLGESVSYLDMNAGIAWDRKFGMFQPRIGVALAHLNQPNRSFLQGDDKLAMLTLFQLQSDIALNERLTITPTFYMNNQGSVHPTLLGGHARYALPGNTSFINGFHGGVYMRNGLTDQLSALSVLGGVRIRTLDILIAYDLPMGDYQATVGSQGALEITLLYRQMPVVLNSYSIPCERY